MPRLWYKLPIAIRAILAGFAVLAAGTLPWTLLVRANLGYGAPFPWAALAELVLLGLLWAYLGGLGWPRSTSATRRRNLRADPPAGALRGWSLISGALYSCALVGLIVIGWMLVEMPPSQLGVIADWPAWSVVVSLLAGSLVAGVVEEAAFRGYMQVPLEERYGPARAIFIVALAFSLAHLPSPLILPIFVVGSLGWGVLAYLSGSILPGILFHTLIDLVAWLWGWLNPEALDGLLSRSALEDGWSSGLGAALAWTAVFAILTVLAFRKMASVRRA